MRTLAYGLSASILLLTSLSSAEELAGRPRPPARACPAPIPILPFAGDEVRITRINQAGQVVGSASTEGGELGFLQSVLGE